MKGNKIVDLSSKAPGRVPPPVTDFWFAQVDTRLSSIERMVRRLEWHIWLIFCGTAALLFLTVLEAFAPNS